MAWRDQLKADPSDWLLEEADPGARYLALRDVLDYPADDPTLQRARVDAHTKGPIAAILDAMDEAGYWVRPGPGYTAKYRSAVWSLIALAQLGASAAQDERIGKACDYLLDHALNPVGQFSATVAPSGTIDCLQGNLCAALPDLGYDDPRLATAFEWMARSVTGEGVAPATEQNAPVRYYAYKSGPLFACGVNNNLACGWGAGKVMLAFARLPVERRTPLIERAIRQGIDYLLSIDPAAARYPTKDGKPPSRSWWKFGFPVFYVTDVLQLVEALVGLGCDGDARLANALEIIRDKQDDQGRWSLDLDYRGRMWVDFGEKRKPNKWVTLRALRVLKAVG
jgi:hypothetical protein